jgi:hypothetical protein
LILVLALAVAGAAEPIDVGAAVRAGCGRKMADEIVVCGVGGARSIYRLPEIAREYAPVPIRAERQLAPGVMGSVGVQSVDLPGGHKSQRLMVTIGTRF